MDDELMPFLERYGAALAGGDLPGISNAYAYPALVVGDEGSIPVSSRDEVEEAFSGGAQSYREQGMTRAIPEIERVDELTGAVVSVDVRWSYADDDGVEKQCDAYRYILRRTEDGPVICLVTPRSTT